MIDIGVNLTNTRFAKDLPEVLARAQQVGVRQMMVTGTNVTESQQAVELCQQFPDYLTATAGVHPHDAANVGDDYLEQLSKLAHHQAVRAIGECGLDFNRNFSPPEQQISVFTEQVELASSLKLPLFLHQRDAFEQWLSILKPYVSKIPAMVSHCFTGNTAQMEVCLEHGMYIGVTGWVCDERRGHELQETVKHLPLDKLMIETDAPYLTPRTIRPKPKSSRNEPAYLPSVVETIAQLKQVTAEQVIAASVANSQRVFGL